MKRPKTTELSKVSGLIYFREDYKNVMVIYHVQTQYCYNDRQSVRYCFDQLCSNLDIFSGFNVIAFPAIILRPGHADGGALISGIVKGLSTKT